MPILKINNINKNVSWALWKIDESVAELNTLYSPIDDELKDLDAIKVEVRKQESLAARLALKHLLKKHGYNYHEIYKDEFGKPHLKDHKIQISISHTKGYGAAAINLIGPVGIDIEYHRDQIRRISKKFLHPSEFEWTNDHIGNLTKVWCAKEALYKLHGRTQLIFAEQLIIAQPDKSNRSIGKILDEHNHRDYSLVFSSTLDMVSTVAF
jgi:4'-phosphopantetheinyl transferase